MREVIQRRWPATGGYVARYKVRGGDLLIAKVIEPRHAAMLKEPRFAGSYGHIASRFVDELGDGLPGEQ